MVKLTKRMNMIHKKVSKIKQYEITEALVLLRELTTVKFTESVDVAIKLNIDPRKPDQNIRGTIILPHYIDRNTCIAVFAQGETAEIAKSAGAEIVGMEDLAEYIRKGRFNLDVVIASPDAMHIVSQLGQILGPRGLMPNIKMGTITTNIAKAIKDAKAGQIHYRNDKNGIVHTTIGKINLEIKKLKENLEFLLITLKRAKPPQIKGIFFKKINISTTMGAGITINQTSLSSIID